ncbi:hypothetical protein EXM98_14205 [Clostridium botulinum]|uniref:Methyltransferase domain-containing protein n=1 Tax=Clostridium botulinum TaxID=1491 RepID=A0AA43Y758_CLOBO|nr:hypothetical protein [Clostridium botulinum]APH17606.1 hypothetical protein NPD3_1331 [Clostridium botulinum]AUM92201.1 hypothetical protein RSJ5_13285 [Clostridium botulinum]MBY6800460.1 hypothetical protein [Clostridium botulinum]MBY6997819.1 hypothetical protein [Clostridium botulinum]MBY7010076.1 hypothetical protein [Clostridium botulinum]
MKDNVVIFGASTRGRYVYEKLKNKYKIIYFCDNDIKKNGNRINGIEIILPQKLYSLRNCRIIIASMYHEEIYSQLNEMGISNVEVYPSNIECTMKRIEEKGVILNEMDVLEVFGGSGKSVDRYVLDKVKKLDVWEIDKNREIELKSNLPKAEIKIVDSFNEVKTTKNEYDVIIIDNPMAMFANHCEHFDMFIHIFNILKDEGLIILDIIPNLENMPTEFEALKEDIHLLCRKLFYRTENPLNIPIKDIVSTYEDIVNKNGYSLEWNFTEERSKGFIYYLVLKVKKTN